MPSSPPSRIRRVALGVAYALPPLPLIFMTPEIGAAMRLQDWPALGLYADTVLGGGILLVFLGSLLVTPLITVSGERWFARLRWYYGTWAGVLSVIALLLVSAVPAARPGVSGRLAGNIIGFTGTMTILLFIPLLVTSSAAAQKWLGKYWKALHRMVWAIWVLILLHLWLIDGASGAFVRTLAASVPLVVLRLPAVRRWWVAERKARHWQAWPLWAAAVPLAAMLLWGLYGLIAEEARMGWLAFTLSRVG